MSFPKRFAMLLLLVGVAAVVLFLPLLSVAAWGQEQVPKPLTEAGVVDLHKPKKLTEGPVLNPQPVPATQISAPPASSRAAQGDAKEPPAVKSEAPAPSPELLRAWEKLQAVLELRASEMRRREQAIEELTQAQIALSAFNGQLDRLSAEFRKLLPAGYRWDAATKSLVKLEPEKPKEEPK